MEAKNKHYTEEFKKQIVELKENGKSVSLVYLSKYQITFQNMF